MRLIWNFGNFILGSNHTITKPQPSALIYRPQVLLAMIVGSSESDPCRPPKLRWSCQALRRNVGTVMFLLFFVSQVWLVLLNWSQLIPALALMRKWCMLYSLLICIPSLFSAQLSIQVTNASEIRTGLFANSVRPSAALSDSHNLGDVGLPIHRKELQTNGELIRDFIMTN